MTDIKKEQRRKFIRYYYLLHNVREAALLSGCCDKDALSEGMEQLLKKSTLRQIKKIKDRLSPDGKTVISGLERLAFGSVNDVASLIFCKDSFTEKSLSMLDLFSVSEIKRDKDGGVSVKFFDRQKALEKMWEIENAADVNSGAESFLKALYSSQADNTEPDDEDDN